jgi:hypothetical protein
MRWLEAVAAVCIFVVVATAPAYADGTYDVYGCHLPDGRTIGTSGWQPAGTSQGVMTNSCAQGGSLTAALLEQQIDDSAEAGWLFAAPADTQIDSFRLLRAVRVSGHRNYHLWQQFTIGVWPPARTDAETCMTWFGPCSSRGDLDNSTVASNVLEMPTLPGTRALHAWLQCGGSEDGPNVHICWPAAYPNGGQLKIWSSRIALADSKEPEFASPPSGALATGGGPIGGVQVVRFSAADRGGGIQTMGILVDGEPKSAQPVDPADPKCKPPYLDTVPCPLKVEPTLAVDTTLLANGTHSLRLFVRDVAGNQAQTDPVSVVIRNGGQPNGVNATGAAKLQAWFKSNQAHRATATVAFNARRTVEGRVTTSDGRPIGAAVLQATAQATRPGSGVRSLGNIVTDAKGRFRFVLPSGSSREVHLGYRANTLDEQEAAGVTLSLNVRAGVRLAVSPRRVRNGTTATFSGRLLGGPGQFGTQVTIYALSARRPIPVETVAADRRGRFRYRYRFSSIAGRVRFRFQAVVKSQPNYPFARGGSAVVTVRARP